MPRPRRIETFAEFWPYYVSQHLTTTCRSLHFVGTTGAIVLVLAGIVTFHGWLIPLGFVFGYGPAWVGHFFFEKNRPATFQYPLWSLLSDFVMYGKMWAGQMDGEITKIANPY